MSPAVPRGCGGRRLLLSRKDGGESRHGAARAAGRRARARRPAPATSARRRAAAPARAGARRLDRFRDVHGRRRRRRGTKRLESFRRRRPLERLLAWPWPARPPWAERSSCSRPRSSTWQAALSLLAGVPACRRDVAAWGALEHPARAAACSLLDARRLPGAVLRAPAGRAPARSAPPRATRACARTWWRPGRMLGSHALQLFAGCRVRRPRALQLAAFGDQLGLQPLDLPRLHVLAPELVDRCGVAGDAALDSPQRQSTSRRSSSEFFFLYKKKKKKKIFLKNCSAAGRAIRCSSSARRRSPPCSPLAPEARRPPPRAPPAAVSSSLLGGGAQPLLLAQLCAQRLRGAGQLRHACVDIAVRSARAARRSPRAARRRPPWIAAVSSSPPAAAAARPPAARSASSAASAASRAARSDASRPETRRRRGEPRAQRRRSCARRPRSGRRTRCARRRSAPPAAGSTGHRRRPASPRLPGVALGSRRSAPTSEWRDCELAAQRGQLVLGGARPFEPFGDLGLEVRQQRRPLLGGDQPYPQLLQLAPRTVSASAARVCASERSACSACSRWLAAISSLSRRARSAASASRWARAVASSPSTAASRPLSVAAPSSASRRSSRSSSSAGPRAGRAARPGRPDRRRCPGRSRAQHATRARGRLRVTGRSCGAGDQHAGDRRRRRRRRSRGGACKSRCALAAQHELRRPARPGSRGACRTCGTLPLVALAHALRHPRLQRPDLDEPRRGVLREQAAGLANVASWAS